MYAQPHEKQYNQDEEFIVEQQINLFSQPMPQINRGESDEFFKQVYREQGQNFAYVQIGFRVGRISTQMHDFVCVLVNQIHCQSQENLKLIIDDDQLWVTSTIVCQINSMGEVSYNMIESNSRQSLIKTREIVRQILKQCRERYDKSQSDEQIMKAIFGKIKKISKAFKDPNADY